MAGRKMSLPKGSSGSGSSSSTAGAILDPAGSDRIKNLYPLVNEGETPLPRSWSPKDKFNFIGLSQNNLRVHYKGHGKGHKDAASVRATHPIPAACGLYYFEVKIVSKGRDGYMGIGLSGSGVSMNRLPGWDKHSYGYHGDDGHSFCSSGTGQPYGPTFTTGDVIGCGINLLDNTCFYTKNGHHLGIAFTDLPVGLSNLYPTVGLQTPGEIVDANFGQMPFVFDVEDMIKELRAKTRLTIQKYPIDNFRNWEGVMNKMVMSYLVHHGYCSTAEAFAKTCGQGQAVAEDLMSMQNRQKIQRLVLEGKIEEAEKETKELYPSLLDTNPDLLFMLRCRHFVELVGQLMSPKSNDQTIKPDGTNGYHLNSYATSADGLENNIHHCNGDILKDPKQQLNNDNIMNHDKSSDPLCEDMEVAYTNGYQNGCSGVGPGVIGGIDEMDVEISSTTTSSSSLKKQPSSSSNSSQSNIESDSFNIGGSSVGDFGDSLHHNSNNSNPDSVKSISNGDVIKDKSITNSPQQPNGLSSNKENGVHSSGVVVDGNANISGVEKILIVGRELQNLNVTLRKTYGYNENNKKIMENAFSLLAYANPYESPVGWQLSSRQREPICAALNSAILQSVQLPRTPPLQVALSHAHLLLSQQARSGLGGCAFVDLEMKADNVK